jgi:hypothetical protein
MFTIHWYSTSICSRYIGIPHRCVQYKPVLTSICSRCTGLPPCICS